MSNTVNVQNANETYATKYQVVITFLNAVTIKNKAGRVGCGCSSILCDS